MGVSETLMREPRIPLRPSTMDRAWICPGSHHPEEGEPLIEVVTDDDSGSIGVVAHKALQCIVTGDEFKLAEVCVEYHVEKDDVGFLIYACEKFHKFLTSNFNVSEWYAEKKVSSDTTLEYSGTADIIGHERDGKRIIIADLKTGRADTSAEHQMRAYSFAALSKAESAESVKAMVLWARDQEIQPWTWTRNDLVTWAVEMQDKVWNWDGVNYTVGGHCTFCRRHASCPARMAELTSTYELMKVSADTHELVGDDFSKAWQASIDIPKLIEQWRARQKERIKATGPIPMEEGKVLTLTDRNVSPKMDAEKAAAVLKSGFGFTDSDVYECCRLSKGDVENKVAESAETGGKGKAKKAVVETLTEYGALLPRTTQVITKKKAEKNEG